MYIRKQVFISRGARPLYIFSINVPESILPEDPKFRDNRERMFIEREEMELQDLDAPFVPDTRTDKEVRVDADLSLEEASLGSKSQISIGNKANGGWSHNLFGGGDATEGTGMMSSWGWGSSGQQNKQQQQQSAETEDGTKSKWGWGSLSTNLGGHKQSHGEQGSHSSGDDESNEQTKQKITSGWKLF
jgi:hypothetical protein